MVDKGLTERVTADRQLSFYFFDCGTIPPPVIMVQVGPGRRRPLSGAGTGGWCPLRTELPQLTPPGAAGVGRCCGCWRRCDGSWLELVAEPCPGADRTCGATEFTIFPQ